MKGLLAIVLFAFTAQAQSFRRSLANDGSQCVTWVDRSFVYQVDQAGSLRTPGDTEFTAIDAAFTSWQAAATSCSDFTFAPGPRVSGGQVGEGTASENLITFREVSCTAVVAPSDPCLSNGSCLNVKRCWDHGPDTIALTTVTYSTRTGIAVDADIELNASNFLFTTISTPPCDEGHEEPTCVAFDVQNTLTHEIGHAVGLDHVDNDASTMAWSAPTGETSKRVIDPGTVRGLCHTYPRGEPAGTCDALSAQRGPLVARNVGSFGVSCEGSVSGGSFGSDSWLIALGLLGLLRKKTR